MTAPGPISYLLAAPLAALPTKLLSVLLFKQLARAAVWPFDYEIDCEIDNEINSEKSHICPEMQY